MWWRKRGARMIVLGSALLTVGAPIAGCATEVEGSARPVTGAASRPLADLLLEPAAFPPRFPAVVLPPPAVAQAAPDLTGIPPGAKVDPAGCKPPAQDFGPDGTVMVVGTDAVSRTTISVELVRVDSPLAELGAQVVECPQVTTIRNGAAAVVTSVLQPPPPIDADATLALRRAVRSGSGDRAVVQSMLTLVAQLGDIRVQATAMSFGNDPTAEDAQVLDVLFTAAVEKARSG